MGDFEGEWLSGAVIGAAMAVHRTLGTGFLESIYENALAVELRRQGIPFERQAKVAVFYNGVRVGKHRVDLLVGYSLVVELKATNDFHQAHRAQIRSYLRATNRPTGLLINFGRESLQFRRIDLKPNPGNPENPENPGPRVSSPP